MFLEEHNAENWGKKRIEKVLNANIPAFIGFEKSINAIKTTMARSLAEFDNFAISYNKESSVLKDSLEQVFCLSGNKNISFIRSSCRFQDWPEKPNLRV